MSTRVVSWNLFGLEDRNLDERTEAAMTQLLLGCSMMELVDGRAPLPLPDVVMLQEVVPRTLAAHVRPHLERAGFTVYPLQSDRSYFEVLAVRQPIVSAEVRRFARSGMGRSCVWVETDTLVFATSHLESLRGGAPVRLEQAQCVLDWMNASSKPVVFAADTNLRVAEAEALDFGDVLDAWTESGSDKGTRFTWGRRARYDRCWGRGVSLSGFSVFGQEDVAGLGEPPSDHLGLRITATVG